jgi:hypothetical protein
MCTKLDTRNGVHHSLADDETAREVFALERGCSSLDEVASAECEQSVHLGMPDFDFLHRFGERRRELLGRRQERRLNR